MNPAISLSLGAAFLVLWLYQHRKPYLLALSAGYALTAVGFSLQIFVLPVGIDLTKCLSSLAFIGGSWAIAGAILTRYCERIPVGALAAFGIAGLAAFGWFMLVGASLGWRILAINFAIGAMALLVAAELRPVSRQGPIEKLLFVIALLSAANLIIRPLVALKLNGPMLTYEQLHESLYWTTALLFHALLSLVMALCLFTAAAMDVVKELKSDSETDQLSGLLNRRGFEQRAAKLLLRARKRSLPVSMVVADLDHFKMINDRFGHDAGDSVIADFASLIFQMAPPGSIAGRLGGEEFAILMPVADQKAARLFAEGVRSAFVASQGFSASFGVAGWYRNEELRSFMRRADTALYAAKAGGRNQVSVFVERREELSRTAASSAV